MESTSQPQVINADIQSPYHHGSTWISISSSLWNAMMSNSRAGMAFTVRLYLMLCRNTLGVVTFIQGFARIKCPDYQYEYLLLSAAGDAGSARLLTHLGEYTEKKNPRRHSFVIKSN